MQRLRMAKETGVLDRNLERPEPGLMQLSTDVSAARHESEAAKRIDRLQSQSREAWVSYAALQERAKIKTRQPLCRYALRTAMGNR